MTLNNLKTFIVGYIYCPVYEKTMFFINFNIYRTVFIVNY